MLFNTVTYPLPFAYPDPKDIRVAISDTLDKTETDSSFWQERYGSARFAINVVTKDTTKELTIYGPTIDPDLVDYSIWLPFRKIKKETNPRRAYFNYLKEGLITIYRQCMPDLEEQIAKKLSHVERQLFSS